MVLITAAVVLAALSLVACHGSHDTGNAGNTADSWAEYHMAEEHHLNGFDATSFFTLHDFNSDGSWTADEVRRMYGLDDESLKDTAEDVKQKGMFLILPHSSPLLIYAPSCQRRLRYL
jgi:hypothetical protein